MFNKIQNLSIYSLTLFLLGIAEIAISTSTFFSRGEPECPEELLK